MLLDIAASIRSRRSAPVASTAQGKLEAPPIEKIWRRLIWFSIIFAIGWVLALLFHGFVAPAYGYDWPQNSFLLRPRFRFSDLTLTWAQSIGPNPYTDNSAQVGGTYFPFAYIVFRGFHGAADTQVILRFIGITLVSLLGVWVWWLGKQRWIWKGDARWPVVVLLSFFIITCNYPVLFGIDRGNIDPLVVCLGYAAIELAKTRRYFAGGLLLAISAASKGFPFAAILYWVRRRRFGAAAIATLVLAALVVVPVLTFDGTLAHSWWGYQRNMNDFRNLYIFGGFSAHYSADGINAIRLLARWQGEPLDIHALVRVYERATLLYAAIASLLALFVIQEKWRELLAIPLIMLVFPNITNDYKLAFLLPPLLDWLTSTAKGWRSTTFGIVTALLLVPKHFYFPSADEASISCVINPALILVLTAVLWPTADETTRVLVRLEDLKKRIPFLKNRARWLDAAAEH